MRGQAGDGQSLITAFRPSQLLTYTPLSQTDGPGQAWSAISPRDAALAASPAAMALQPDGDRLRGTLRGNDDLATTNAPSGRAGCDLMPGL
jgi:hypothetical protein